MESKTTMKRELTRAELRSLLDEKTAECARLQNLATETSESHTELEERFVALAKEAEILRVTRKNSSAQIKDMQSSNRALSDQVEALDKQLSIEKMHYKNECELRADNLSTIKRLEGIISDVRNSNAELGNKIKQHQATIERIYARKWWQRLRNTKVE